MDVRPTLIEIGQHTFFPYQQLATRRNAPQRLLAEVSRLRGLSNNRSTSSALQADVLQVETHCHSTAIDAEAESFESYLCALPSMWNLVTYPNQSELTRSIVPSTLSINVTEQCNIACTYCYFTGGYQGNRTHNSSVISETSIAAAISLFFDKSQAGNNRTPACLYLFGGEPLLAPDLVGYILTSAEKLPPETVISMASNGMLLNHENVELLKSRAVTLAISIDGPTHDKHRVFRNGNGTRRLVLEKIDWLYHEHREYLTSSVSTSCVVTQLDHLDELFEFFYRSDSLRAVIHWDFDILLSGSSESAPAFSSEPVRQLVDWYLEYIFFADKSSDLVKWHYFFASGFNAVHRTFWSSANWFFAPEPNCSVIGPLGTYLEPGSSMVTLRPNGDLIVGNERQKEAYRIGHVAEGISIEKVTKIERSFSQVIDRMGCSRCWAAPMCTLNIVDFDIEDFAEDLPILATYFDRCSLERAFLSQFLERFEVMSPSEVSLMGEFIGHELSQMR